MVKLLRLSLSTSLLLVAYIGLAHLIIDIKSKAYYPLHPITFGMQTPLLPINTTSYSPDKDTNPDGYWSGQTNADPFSSTPTDDTGYFQNEWNSTNPSSGYGYWSNGQWILTSPTGSGYWHHGRWVTTDPASPGSGFWQFGTWVDTPEIDEEAIKSYQDPLINNDESPTEPSDNP